MASDLDAIAAAIQAELVRATADRHHAWRTPTLATVRLPSEAGGAPEADARTVVLRETRRDRLVVYTDARSAKVTQIAACPRGTLVFWSPKLSWQLRVACALSVATEGPAVEEAFARVQASPSAKDYLAARAPGATIDGPAEGSARGEEAFFAVLTAGILSMDWLEIAREGHRRARFDADGATWLVP